MGGDSCSKGCKLESRHRILDGHFFNIHIVVKFVMFVWKDENKWKKDRGWPFKKTCFEVRIWVWKTFKIYLKNKFTCFFIATCCCCCWDAMILMQGQVLSSDSQIQNINLKSKQWIQLGQCTVGWAVTSGTRNPWFKSSHRQFLFHINCNKKIRRKKKESWNGQLFKSNH